MTTENAIHQKLSARDLLDKFLEGAAFEAPAETYFPTGLPDTLYECVSLAELSVPKTAGGKTNISNKSNFDITNCFVWYPVGKRRDIDKFKFAVIAHSPNCTVYMLELPKGMTFRLNGPGHSILNLSTKRVSANIRMTGGDGLYNAGSRVLVGQNTFIAGARMVLKNTDLLIGHNALWSDEILVQGSNQHGIVELPSRTLVHYPRNRVILAPHVWVGRRAILSAGAAMGKGSMVGTGALVAKAFPPAVIVAGNPARVLKMNRTWAFHQDKILEREMEIIDDLAPVVVTDAPRWKKALDTVWFKAASAGAAATLAVEFVLELLPSF